MKFFSENCDESLRNKQNNARRDCISHCVVVIETQKKRQHSSPQDRRASRRCCPRRRFIVMVTSWQSKVVEKFTSCSSGGDQNYEAEKKNGWVYVYSFGVVGSASNFLTLGLSSSALLLSERMTVYVQPCPNRSQPLGCGNRLVRRVVFLVRACSFRPRLVVDCAPISARSAGPQSEKHEHGRKALCLTRPLRNSNLSPVVRIPPSKTKALVCT